MSKNKTSSYLDLSPLYGSNQAMQDSVRTFKEGRMKPDAYADSRLLGMAPGVSVILIMFNRVCTTARLAAENVTPYSPLRYLFLRVSLSPDNLFKLQFHNYVAENLAAINEGGRFTKPSQTLDEADAAAAWKKYDNDLFQTARLVTAGLYIVSTSPLQATLKGF